MNDTVKPDCISNYRIAGNFRGVKIRYFRGQADPHEMLT